ncbi:hypothetical protein EVAR_20108_1 [Eumeta japonica]|uniref:Uncharacterized protein n=1 Tax=Eumeta variegata TaxID=151549 RepID=A0A4C1V2B0_EUMVA|nr:hypothetical protein EVAR_20108_1 [Eumeta japonica]
MNKPTRFDTPFDVHVLNKITLGGTTRQPNTHSYKMIANLLTSRTAPSPTPRLPDPDGYPTLRAWVELRRRREVARKPAPDSCQQSSKIHLSSYIASRDTRWGGGDPELKLRPIHSFFGNESAVFWGISRRP